MCLVLLVVMNVPPFYGCDGFTSFFPDRRKKIKMCFCLKVILVYNDQAYTDLGALMYLGEGEICLRKRYWALLTSVLIIH